MSAVALRNVEQTYNALMKNPGDIVVSANEAATIWKLFRKYPINPAQLEPAAYRAFLQAAIMGAIDGSAAMSWIRAIFDSAYAPDASVADLMKKLAMAALRKYYHHLRGDKPVIYSSMTTAISWGCSFYFDSIATGGEI